ncbi:Cof-type HAD-IIB family hydrolase [Neobacillus notoginsengisoli]|uniref:Cof-type HAD-IIB family hydrolase n=1 Tax=Neobacillus notoginsengisoli TaxID=1578198 RepID=A0A417YY60_9BACI|nr:Cof-type HAD-IIB family hydrolase [Neobacillus notoginsengisoli]RHW42676.1 Cof-type HAD-IIB family hydrolase [Neobacillus notoginsengisoli]
MEKSIIFFDIDGTLLDDEKRLPASAKEAVFKLKELGHEVAIATGRAPFMFEDLRKELGIDTYVSFNGQYVVLQGKPVYTNQLNEKALEALTLAAAENNHPLIYMDEVDMKMSVPEHNWITESIGTLKLTMGPTHEPEYFRGRTIFQTLLFCEQDDELKYEDAFKEFDFIRWHPVSVDVLPVGGSKAKGIEELVEAMGLHIENAYAFGDGLNDIEMLSYVPNSVAMGNALPEVKEAARYETIHVNDGGILHGLKLVGLL